MYTFYGENIPKISLCSIKFLTCQLEEFIKLYEKKVFISNEDDKKRIEDLKKILSILKAERYELLINDPGRIIDYADDNGDYLPDYFPL
jgi:hypothetical protein